MASELLELASRVKALTGPSREVDALIANLLMLPLDWGMSAQRYTASLDAAITLVPEGVAWGFVSDYGGLNRAHIWNADMQERWEADAATPALALCAAALRSRHHSGETAK